MYNAEQSKIASTQKTVAMYEEIIEQSEDLINYLARHEYDNVSATDINDTRVECLTRIECMTLDDVPAKPYDNFIIQ